MRLLSVLVLVGLFVLAGFYLGEHLDEFRQALAWPPWFLALLSVLIITHFIIIGLFTRVVLKVFGVALSMKEWFGLAVITTLGNYLMPFRGGSGLRAAYLKKKHSLFLTDFLSTYLAFNLLTLLVNALAALAALGAVRGSAAPVIALFFSIVLAGTLMIAVFPVPPSWLERPLLAPLARVMAGCAKIKERPRMIFNLIILSIANTLSQVLMVYFGYRAMGLETGLAGAVLVTAFLVMGSLAAITPGGFGVQEAILVFSSQVLGVSPAQGLALGLTIRAVILFWTFLFGPVFSYLLLKKPLPLAADSEGE